MRFTLSTLLLPLLALFPLLIQGAPLSEEPVAVTAQGIKIHSAGPVVHAGSDSGSDGGRSKFGVGPEIPQRHPASPSSTDGDVGLFVPVDIDVDVNLR